MGRNSNSPVNFLNGSACQGLSTAVASIAMSSIFNWFKMEGRVSVHIVQHLRPFFIRTQYVVPDINEVCRIIQLRIF